MKTFHVFLSRSSAKIYLVALARYLWGIAKSQSRFPLCEMLSTNTTIALPQSIIDFMVIYRPKKWFQAQCAHYGLPTKGYVPVLRVQLDTFLASPTAHVPEALAQLEAEKDDEYRTLNERIKAMTSRARSPMSGRTRRVTMSNVPDSEPVSPQPSGAKAPRSRTTSAAPPSQTRAISFEVDQEPQVPVKRGRGRPRKSEPAPATHRSDGSPTSTERAPITRGKEQKKGKEKEGGPILSKAKRPDPPSQTDSTVSAYSELDDEVMEVLDDIENGMDLLDNDADGDSQMNSPAPRPSSPPPAPSSPVEPRTPRRPHHVSALSPSTKSPRSTLERDVVSGMWALRVVGHTIQLPTPPRGGPVAGASMGASGSMNLHLAEDKRSLVGDFSLLGMDGVVQSKTLDGRADGAYARLLFVGQMAAGKGNGGAVTNRVFGPSSSQSGYLRFSDGRKGDGRFTLKGTLQGGGYGKVDFEGVREGEEQELCAAWDDFVD
jgi:hypothetical protein